jgi:hypothetical protein
MTRHIRLYAIALFMLGGVALAACGDGADAQDPSATPPSGTPTAEPTIEPTIPSGIASVDALIDAIEKRDFDALRELLRLEPEPCAAPGQGSGGPPACEPGEGIGTPVDVLPFASCEGYWVREGALLQALSPLVQGNARLHGVYREEQMLFDRQGDYAVLFDLAGDAAPRGANILVTDDGVTGVSFGCGETAAQLVQALGLADLIVGGEGVDAGNGASCVAGAADALCRLAAELDRAARDGNTRPFQLLVDGGQPEAITCDGTGRPIEATFLCEGAAPGEVRPGYRLAVHGSEGTVIAPAGLRDMVSNHVTRGATLASTGCSSTDGCKTFIIAFSLGSSEPRVFYLAFEEAASGGEHVIVGAGVSGDNADAFLDGGETFTVAGEATLVKWQAGT